MTAFQVQKKHYRHEKKRAAKELLSALKDTSVTIIADWLKVRGSLKSWTKLWCVLKPGLLLLYKSHKTKVYLLSLLAILSAGLCCLLPFVKWLLLSDNAFCFLYVFSELSFHWLTLSSVLAPAS